MNDEPQPAQLLRVFDAEHCRMLLQATHDQCPEPPLDDYGLCTVHLQQIGEYWAKVLSETVRKFPAIHGLIAIR
jgi:hypothetical protein